MKVVMALIVGLSNPVLTRCIISDPQFLGLLGDRK